MMKIAKVKAVPLRIPFAQIGTPVVIFGRPMTAVEILLVEVETEDGITGYGETAMWTWRAAKAMIDDFIAPIVVGRDATDIASLMHDVQRLTTVLGRYGITMFALSGLDTALWDIAGKAAGQPLYRLFGAARKRIPGYVSVWASMKKGAAWDWESADPEILKERTRIALSTGVRHLKFHGTADSDLRTIEETAGDDVRIMIDAMCRWTLPQAREGALRLKSHGVHWLEEPIFPPEDYASLGRLQAETGMAIAAGENACTAFEFAAMFAADAVTFAQPAVHKVGGITEFRKVAALATVHGVEVSAHSHCFGPGLLATMHLMSAQERPGLMERSQIPLEASLYGSAADIVDGHFQPPDGPGLGVEPNPDVLRDYRIAST